MQIEVVRFLSDEILVVTCITKQATVGVSSSHDYDYYIWTGIPLVALRYKSLFNVIKNATEETKT